MKPGEWIRVDKRLPEPLKDMIAYFENGTTCFSWVDYDGVWAYTGIYGRVTHWMPVLEPPERRNPNEAD